MVVLGLGFGSSALTIGVTDGGSGFTSIFVSFGAMSAVAGASDKVDGASCCSTIVATF